MDKYIPLSYMDKSIWSSLISILVCLISVLERGPSNRQSSISDESLLNYNRNLLTYEKKQIVSWRTGFVLYVIPSLFNGFKVLGMYSYITLEKSMVYHERDL